MFRLSIQSRCIGTFPLPSIQASGAKMRNGALKNEKSMRTAIAVITPIGRSSVGRLGRAAPSLCSEFAGEATALAGGMAVVAVDGQQPASRSGPGRWRDEHGPRGQRPIVTGGADGHDMAARAQRCCGHGPAVLRDHGICRHGNAHTAVTAVQV